MYVMNTNQQAVQRKVEAIAMLVESLPSTMPSVRMPATCVALRLSAGSLRNSSHVNTTHIAASTAKVNRHESSPLMSAPAGTPRMLALVFAVMTHDMARPRSWYSK